MTARTNRIPLGIAGLALVAVTAVACGSDTSSDDTATDTASSSSPTSASSSPSTSTSSDPSVSATATAAPSGDPTPSPLINKAAGAAIKAQFPALVPAGVPDGWTAVSAAYKPAGGGSWQIKLTDDQGRDVVLVQTTAALDQLVTQNLPDAQAAGKVDLSSYGTGNWTAYTGGSGAALAKSLSGTAVVVMAADQDTAVTLAQELLTAEDSGNTDGG